MPAAHVWAMDMPCASPEPTYNPSTRRTSTQARETRETASTGAKALIGTPPTPIRTSTLPWGEAAMSAPTTSPSERRIRHVKFQSLPVSIAWRNLASTWARSSGIT